MTRTVGAFLVVLALAAPLWAAQDNDRSSSSKAAAAGLVNLNTATQAQLEELPGVGPKIAERIIEYRQKNGGFKKIEDLMQVRGVGEKSFLKLKALITVTPPRTERAGQKQ